MGFCSEFYREGNVVYLQGKVRMRCCPNCFRRYKQKDLEELKYMAEDAVCPHCHKALIREFCAVEWNLFPL